MDYSEQYQLKLDLEEKGIIEKLHGVDKALQNIPKSKTVTIKTNGLEKMASTLNSISKYSGKVGSSLDGLGSKLTKISAISLAPVALALGKTGSIISNFAKDTIDYSANVEQSKATLRAQGIEASKLQTIFKDIVNFANISPFDVGNMTDAVSMVNAYVGNIDKSLRASKVFGTSLYASGQDASVLQRVAVNLGQLDTGEFKKSDYKELLQGVPAVAQALRDINIKTWDEFNEALGDNPNTKEIERTGNALDLVTNALDKYNVKTNALEESNKSLKATFDNSIGQFQTMRDEVLNSSGAFDAIKKTMTTFSEKMNSPEVKRVFEEVFSSAVPYIDKINQKIKDFNLQKFIDGIKKGYTTIKTTFGDIATEVKKAFSILENIPFIGNFIKTIKSDLQKGEIGLGQALGNWISAGLKVGTTGIKLKLAGGAFNIVSSITGGLSTILGGASGLSKAISQKFGPTISKEISLGLNNSIAKNPPKLPKLTNKMIGTDLGKSMMDSMDGYLVAQTDYIKAQTPGAVGKFTSGFNKVMGSLSKAIGVAAKAGFAYEGVLITDELRKTLKGYNIKQNTELVKMIGEVIPDDLPEIQSINKKINNLETWTNELSKIDIATGMDKFITGVAAFSAIGGGIAGLHPATAAAGAGLMLGGLVAQGIQTLGEFNSKLKLDNIKTLVDLPAKIAAIPDLSKIDIKNKLESISTSIDELHGALRISSSSPTSIDKDNVFSSVLKSKIVAINEALPSDVTGEISKTFANLKTFSDSLYQIGNVGDIADKALEGMNRISTAIDKLTNSELFKPKGTILQNNPHLIGPVNPKGNILDFSTYSETLSSRILQFQAQLKPFNDGTVDIPGITESINNLNSLIQSFQQIPDLGDPKVVEIKMTAVGTVLSQIQSAFRPVAVAGGNGDIPSLIDTRWMDNMIESVNKVLPIIERITGIKDIQGAEIRMDSIKRSIQKIQEAFLSTGSKLIDTRWMDNMITSVDKFLPIIDKINGLEIPNLLANIDLINSAITKLKGLGDVGDISANIPEFSHTVSTLSQIDEKIKQIVGNIPAINSMATAFSAVDLKVRNTSLSVDKLRAAIASLPVSKKITIEAIDNATPILNYLNNYKLENKTISISADISAASNAISELNRKSGAISMATGGTVGGNYAKGGIIGRTLKSLGQRLGNGQDIMKINASPGEFMIKRSAANKIGYGSLEAINAGNLARAYELMSQRVSHSVSSVRNYTTTYNNNNAQIHQNIHNNAQQYNSYNNLRGIVRGL